MPIRINLKELFPSDSQEIHVDKTNWNFNRLLELGIGEQGIRGLLGGLGGLGPIGIDGDPGPRGATWFVDAGADPNILTFPIDLISGDMYLDSTNLAIWQYDGTAWIFVADISNIINNYLLASPSPFIRGFGVGSPDDDRYILFNNRDNPDNALGVNGPRVENDILLLNNWDEDALHGALTYANPPGPEVNGISFPNTDEFFNSILALSVDHTLATTGRYHIELGSLYTNTGGDVELSTIFENFKGKFYKNVGSVHPAQEYNTLMDFSLEVPDGIALDPNQTMNGLFKFTTPKYLYDVNPLLTVHKTATTYIGSRYGIDQLAGLTELTKVDGIAFNGSGALGTIGLSIDNTINGGRFPADTGYVQYNIDNKYIMVDNLANIVSIYLNDELWQDGGNIIQLGTTAPTEKNTGIAEKGAPSYHYGHMGIAVIGTDVYTVSGSPFVKTASSSDLVNNYGYFNRFNIDDPTDIKSRHNYTSFNYVKFNGRTYPNTVSVGVGVCPQPYNYTNPIGPGASDAASFGEYICVVNTQQRGLTDEANTTFPSHFNDKYDHTYFQVLKTNEHNDYGLKRVGQIGWDGDPASDITYLTSAYRVMMHGNHAIVGTNNLHGFNTPGDSYTLAGINYDGRVVSVDVSDPENPAVSSFAIAPTTLDPLENPRHAIMDMDIVGENIYTLNWEQETTEYNVGTNPTNDIVIDVKAFTTRELDSGYGSSKSLQYIGKSATTLLTSSVDEVNFPNVHRHGAICASRDEIFVGYGNKLVVYSTKDVNGLQTNYPDCEFSYPQLGSDAINIPSNRMILDMKLIGNSLYILTRDEFWMSTIYKFDITNRTFLLGSQLHLIWSKELLDPDTGFTVRGNRFIVIGKYIYVAALDRFTDENDVESLIAVDFDGFYTGGAHIESLRTDSLTVTKDSKFGGDVQMSQSATVGGELGVMGNLAIAADIRAPRFTHIGLTGGLQTEVNGGNPEQLMDFDDTGDVNDEFKTGGSLSRFSPKYSGTYLFSFQHAGLSNIGDWTDLGLYINDDPTTGTPIFQDIRTADITNSFSWVLELEAGDDIELWQHYFININQINGIIGRIDRLV